MNICLVTGSGGLIGSETVRYFHEKNFHIVGIDNDMRAELFGKEASTRWKSEQLKETFGKDFTHFDVDIRNKEEIDKIFQKYGSDIKLIVHTAAQPSHDWAAKDPIKDFTINANGTLNLLEATRNFSPDAVFIFTSTNKVYGDTPNLLPLIEQDLRWEIDSSHKFVEGIDESMSIDASKHSLFGASKVAADILVQEYGKYFGMKTASFRGGCLTGPAHSGTELHGFLAYLMACTITGKPYTIFGYKGKQVRDNIHSYDLVNAFYHFYKNPKIGEVYNIGGSRHSNCSMMEGILKCEEISGKKLNYTLSDDNRIGDHIWYISDVDKFQKHYPNWNYKYDVEKILTEIYEAQVKRV